MGATVLISGAGVAGTTLAYWLARRGFTVTVVERAEGQRSSGNPVDVKGPAVDVVRRMGVLARLRAAGTGVDRMTFVDSGGARVATLRLSVFEGGAGADEVELPRAELAAVLADAAADRAEFRWGTGITAIAQRDGEVEATFADGTSETFDFVVGADGLHSEVRRLVFGPEREFRTHQGMYVATVPVPEAFGSVREVMYHNLPGRAVGVGPGGGRPIAAFIFRAAEVPALDHRDTDAHKRMVMDTYADARWRVPELLDHVRAADDLYFDSVSRIDLPRWSAGRVALVGDAASCLSLLGDGSTLAIVGAYTLAESLAAAGHHTGAFDRYETLHRRLVTPRQRNFRAGAAFLVPKTGAGIMARAAAVRALSLADAVRSRLSRHPSDSVGTSSFGDVARGA